MQGLAHMQVRTPLVVDQHVRVLLFSGSWRGTCTMQCLRAHLLSRIKPEVRRPSCGARHFERATGATSSYQAKIGEVCTQFELMW